jgi:DNA-binding transcriptional MerR regulator
MNKPFRPPTLDDVRRAIHRKVTRDLGIPLAEVAAVLKKYNITYDEFMVIADSVIQSYDALREIMEQKGRAS